MARKETIVNSAWTTDFVGLSAFATLLYIWSWTNEHASLCGIYEIKRPVIEFESKVQGEDLAAALTELEAAGLMFYDEPWLCVPARIGNINRGAPNVKKAVMRDVALVPEGHRFRALVEERYPTYFRASDHPLAKYPMLDGLAERLGISHHPIISAAQMLEIGNCEVTVDRVIERLVHNGTIEPEAKVA